MKNELSQLRHLYANLINGGVRDTASAKRIAEGLLAPAIERLEKFDKKLEDKEKAYSLEKAQLVLEITTLESRYLNQQNMIKSLMEDYNKKS